jgi:hypothetical protein
MRRLFSSSVALVVATAGVTTAGGVLGDAGQASDRKGQAPTGTIVSENRSDA